MKSNLIIVTIIILVVGLFVNSEMVGLYQTKESPKPETTTRTKSEQAADPTMATMLKLVGGTWTTEGKFVAQFRYVKTNKGKGIRGIGVIGKGTPQAMESVSMFGWDPGKKSVYYIDFHGHDTVYKGNITTVGKELQFDFTGIVGDEGVYRSSMELTDRDTMVSSLYGKKDGEWVNVHSLTFKRTK